MVYARTKQAAAALSRAVQDGAMVKEYVAMVHGTPPESGDWEDLLWKDSRKNKVYVVKRERAGVKKARLEFTRLSAGECSLVRVRLHTGRSHQIRVQFDHIGCPLWGDQRYGFNVNRRGQQLALWAAVLELVHPIKKEKMRLVCRRPEGEPWSLFEDGLYPGAQEDVLSAGTAEK